MAHHLPLVATQRRDHTYCAHCPKLCRHACPVATVQGSETTTPWALMTSLHHADRGNLEVDESVAAAWFACTGCGGCKSYCEHDNDVPSALYAARAHVTQRRLAPAEAAEVTARHAEREARVRATAESLFGRDERRIGRTRFVPGCTVLGTEPEDASLTKEATVRLVGDEVDVSPGCCGLPLLEAGDAAGFEQAARRFYRDARGSQRLVFADAGCMHAMTVLAPQHGVTPTAESIHLVELAAKNLDKLTESIPRATYHDACRLGRGLGLYEPPRTVIERIAKEVIELPANREHAGCSGAGGQLPRTDRATSSAVADETLRGHDGESVLVSGCPGAARSFQKRGAEALALSTLIARSVLERGER